MASYSHGDIINDLSGTQMDEEQVNKAYLICFTQI